MSSFRSRAISGDSGAGCDGSGASRPGTWPTTSPGTVSSMRRTGRLVPGVTVGRSPLCRPVARPEPTNRASDHGGGRHSPRRSPGRRRRPTVPENRTRCPRDRGTGGPGRAGRRVSILAPVLPSGPCQEAGAPAPDAVSRRRWDPGARRPPSDHRRSRSSSAAGSARCSPGHRHGHLAPGSAPPRSAGRGRCSGRPGSAPGPAIAPTPRWQRRRPGPGF
jgi:hypothetical protein